MSESKPVALKPCPLCGGSPKWDCVGRDEAGCTDWSIECDCGCVAMDLSSGKWSKQQAADRWNTRPAPSPDVADDLTAVYLAGKRDGREEAAAHITALQAQLDEAREAILLAANRLDRCVVDYVAGGAAEAYTVGKWADEARATLAKLKDKSHAG